MGNGDDTAVLELTGLNGIATRTVFNKGLPLASNNEINVPFGFGIWDENNSSFVIDASGAPYVESTKDAMEEEMLFTLNERSHVVVILRVEFGQASLLLAGEVPYILDLRDDVGDE